MIGTDSLTILSLIAKLNSEFEPSIAEFRIQSSFRTTDTTFLKSVQLYLDEEKNMLNHHFAMALDDRLPFIQNLNLVGKNSDADKKAAHCLSASLKKAGLHGAEFCHHCFLVAEYDSDPKSEWNRPSP